MRIPVWLVLVAALVGVVIVVGVGLRVLQPPQPLLTQASFSLDKITPNADGSDDVTLFSYHLTRSAHVSLTLDDNGKSYAFRQNEPRAPGDYQVAFSGVVDGFSLPGDQFAGKVLRRLIPDGSYTWTLTADADDASGTASRTGTLVVADGDAPLPEIQNFAVSPTNFTPNQDGVDDRVEVTLFLTKDSDLSVYLQDASGEQYYIPELQQDAQIGKAGRHTFDYDGGIDQGENPPPNGAYTLVAQAQDAVGQVMQVSSSLTIKDGGKPRAQIIPQPSGPDVVFVSRPWNPSDALKNALIVVPSEPGDNNTAPITMPVGDLLEFRLTVQNYSSVPIRTIGPAPGTIYSQEQRASSLGYYGSAGSWRVGIDCETAISDYPWRWAIGADDKLRMVKDPKTGEIFKYLDPGQQTVVWGAIRMTDLVPTYNPQQCWAGLIHEDVDITTENANVGPREVELAGTPEATAEATAAATASAG